MPDRSPLDFAAETLGDRWVLLLLGVLGNGPQRFSDLAERLPAVAPNVLTTRLRGLERAGLVATTPYSLRPRRVTYGLTGSGREVAELLPALGAWASRHGATGEPERHATCGTPIEVVRWCPTCEARVDDPDADAYWV